MPEMTRRQLAARTLRAIPKAGGPALALVLDLLGPVLAFVTWHAVNVRAVWRRATTLERALVVAVCANAVLAVVVFVGLMRAPALYEWAFQLHTVAALVFYPALAYLLCRHVAEAGRVRRELLASRAEYTSLLTRRVAEALTPRLVEGADPKTCVVKIGNARYTFEYFDGEWRDA